MEKCAQPILQFSVFVCGCSSKNFLSFALALFALGIWCIISVDLVPGSHCSGRLGVAEEYRKLDFMGDVSFRGCNAWFDSGYMFCVSTLVAMDVFLTFSTLRQTRILKCCSPFCCRTEKRAQSMLLVAVLLCAVRTWKTGHYFYEIHVGQHSSPYFYCIFGLLFGVEARRFSVCQLNSMTCGHTHPMRARVRNNNNTSSVSLFARDLFSVNFMRAADGFHTQEPQSGEESDATVHI